MRIPLSPTASLGFAELRLGQSYGLAIFSSGAEKHAKAVSRSDVVAAADFLTRPASEQQLGGELYLPRCAGGRDLTGIGVVRSAAVRRGDEDSRVR